MQITLSQTKLDWRNSYMERKEDREKLHLGEAVDHCAGGSLAVAINVYLFWALSVSHCATERNCRDPKVSQNETLIRIGARDISLSKKSLALFVIAASLIVYHSTKKELLSAPEYSWVGFLEEVMTRKWEVDYCWQRSCQYVSNGPTPPPGRRKGVWDRAEHDMGGKVWCQEASGAAATIAFHFFVRKIRMN